MTTSLVWFRNDLRLDDNPALARALTEADDVAAVFFACHEQWSVHDWGPAKTDFVLRNVDALDHSLRSVGLELMRLDVTTFDDALSRLEQIVAALGVDSVYANRELEVNERRRDREAGERLAALGVEWHLLDDQTIAPIDAIRTKSGDPYSVFTPFHRAWISLLVEQGLPRLASPPRSAASFPPPDRERADAHQGWPNWPAADRVRELFPAGEAEAKRRLNEFLWHRSARYHEERDDPNASATSTISPYLAAGVISPRRALASAVEANRGLLTGGPNPGLSGWIRQLAWRDFYRHVLIHHPRVSMGRPYQRETEAVEWRVDPERFDDWAGGETGFPLVDAAMRALAAEGWLHNRLRMIVASFLTKDLLADWRLGERHFAHHLVDLDLANNNGGWQWAASTGTDAAPYFRVFNPWRQSERFDPDGRFIHRWVPELSGVEPRALHDPDRLERAREDTNYPQAIVDHAVARQRAIAAFR